MGYAKKSLDVYKQGITVPHDRKEVLGIKDGGNILSFLGRWEEVWSNVPGYSMLSESAGPNF